MVSSTPSGLLTRCCRRRCESYSYVVVISNWLLVNVARRTMPTAAASSMKSALDAQCSTVGRSPVHVRSNPPPSSACVQVTLSGMPWAVWWVYADAYVRHEAGSPSVDPPVSYTHLRAHETGRNLV